MKTTRQLALEWWNNLLLGQARDYSIRYFPEREMSSLTGREIEEIWTGTNIGIAVTPKESKCSCKRERCLECFPLPTTVKESDDVEVYTKQQVFSIITYCRAHAEEVKTNTTLLEEWQELSKK